MIARGRAVSVQFHACPARAGVHSVPGIADRFGADHLKLRPEQSPGIVRPGGLAKYLSRSAVHRDRFTHDHRESALALYVDCALVVLCKLPPGGLNLPGEVARGIFINAKIAPAGPVAQTKKRTDNVILVELQRVRCVSVVSRQIVGACISSLKRG